MRVQISVSPQVIFIEEVLLGKSPMCLVTCGRFSAFLEELCIAAGTCAHLVMDSRIVVAVGVSLRVVAAHIGRERGREKIVGVWPSILSEKRGCSPLSFNQRGKPKKMCSGCSKRCVGLGGLVRFKCSLLYLVRSHCSACIDEHEFVIYDRRRIER
eukprot:3060951-Amphidinium_carterae.4